MFECRVRRDHQNGEPQCVFFTILRHCGRLSKCPPFIYRGYSIGEMKVYGNKLVYPVNKGGDVSFLSEATTTLEVSGGFGPGCVIENQFNSLRLDISSSLDKKYPTLQAEIEINRRILIERSIQIISEDK